MGVDRKSRVYRVWARIAINNCFQPSTLIPWSNFEQQNPAAQPRGTPSSLLLRVLRLLRRRAVFLLWGIGPCYHGKARVKLLRHTVTVATSQAGRLCPWKQEQNPVGRMLVPISRKFFLLVSMLPKRVIWKPKQLNSLPSQCFTLKLMILRNIRNSDYWIYICKCLIGRFMLLHNSWPLLPEHK